MTNLHGKDSTDFPLDQHLSETPHMIRVSKSKAGRLLDAREWNQLPTDILEGEADADYKRGYFADHIKQLQLSEFNGDY